MSYIGNTPTNQNFVAGADQFSGNGSTTAFTLSRNVNTVFDIFVAISNVPQDPYSAYSVSGNTLTFTSAPPSGTGNIYVVYRATNVQTFVPTPGATVGGSFGIQGNLNFFSTGNRITGDFSNGTLANRVAFQSSTTNGETSLVVIPNGTSTTTRIQLGDASNLSGSGNFLNLFNTGSEVSIRAGTYSGGTGLPMTFYTNGSERMRIDTSGNVGIGTSSPSSNSLTLASKDIVLSDGYGPLWGTSTKAQIAGYSSGILQFFAGGSSERMRIDSSGNLQLSTAGTKVLNSSGRPILNQTGSVLQVVNAAKTDTFVTSATVTDTAVTGLTVTITPSSTSSTILVLVNLGIAAENAQGGATKLTRTVGGVTTQLSLAAAAGSRSRSSFAGSAYRGSASGYLLLVLNQNLTYIDSPATTSAITYGVQVSSLTTGTYINRSGTDTDSNDTFRGVSYITAMEIAG